MEYKSKKNPLFTEKFIFTAILFVGVLSLYIYTWTWPPGPRALPLWVCFFTLVLLAVQLSVILKSVRGNLDKNYEKSEDLEIKKVLLGFVTLGGSVLISFIIGLVASVGLMGVGLSYLYGERQWWILAIMGIGAASLMYLLFGIVLNLPLHY
jgi:small-conductance mechanosensitive channel